MKRMKSLAVFLCLVLLTGCAGRDNPYKVDTVIRIPVDPTEAVVETVTETEAPTEAPTEAAATEETAEPTEAASEKKPSSAKKSTASSKKSSSTKKKTPSKQEKPKETELPTQPPTEPEETAAPTEPEFDPSGYSAGKLERAILEEVNDSRGGQEAGELTMSAKLCGIAALRAREAARVWSHTRPDGSNYTTAMSDYGYSFSTSAEIMAHASGSGKASAIVGKWLDADSREKLLSSDFTKAGVGVYREDGTVWVVMLLVG